MRQRSRDFQQHNRGDQHALDIFNGGGDVLRRWPSGEVFEPRRRINQIHTRSRSRGTVVSMPFRNPRIFRIAWTGMNSMRF